MVTEPDITKDNLYHSCAAWAYWEALAEGKQNDLHYVRRLADLYYREARERGEK